MEILPEFVTRHGLVVIYIGFVPIALTAAYYNRTIMSS